MPKRMKVLAVGLVLASLASQGAHAIVWRIVGPGRLDAPAVLLLATVGLGLLALPLGLLDPWIRANWRP
jgi:hypothetical protein